MWYPSGSSAIAIAVAIAAVCYRIAEGKGRSGVLWAILGFLLPIIALIIVFAPPGQERLRAAIGPRPPWQEVPRLVSAWSIASRQPGS